MASILSRLDLERERQLLKLFPKPVRFNLLYKGSHHGFSINTLESKFDTVGQFLITMYLQSGLVRGGYLSKPLKSGKNEDPYAFVLELNQQKATKFPAQDLYSCILDLRSVSFGNSFKLYNVKNIFYVNFSDDKCVNTGWSEETGLCCVEVEMHRVQEIGDVLPNTWREVSWTERDRDNLRESFVSHKPSCEALTQVRVLMLGPTGAGKSSFINSIRSVMYGRVTHLPIVGIATEGFTKKLKSYDIRTERGGSATALTLCDVMALGDSDTTGLTLSNTLAVIKGHFPDGHKFQRDTPINTTISGYWFKQSLKDQIQGVVFVLDASKVMSYTEDQQKTLRRFHGEMSDLDMPQMILLTHVDQVCHAVSEDVKYVYTSRVLQEKMHKAAELVGLPVSCVLPVKNYVTEHSVNCNMDILLLSAVEHILQAIDDTLEDLYPASAAESPVATVTDFPPLPEAPEVSPIFEAP